MLLLLLVLAMWFAPNIATAIDVMSRADLRQTFGGGVRFMLSLLITIVFVILLSSAQWASHTVFLVRLLTGRSIGWGAQTRDDHALSWTDAARYFWPQTLIGAAPVLLLAVTAPIGHPIRAVHRRRAAVLDSVRGLTSNPAAGRALIAVGLDRLPEETAPPPELRALALPAIELTLRQVGRSAPEPAQPVA